MKKIVIYTLLLIVMSGCEYEYNNTPAEMKPYISDNDTICFVDNAKLQADTAIIKVVKSYNYREYSREDNISIYYYFNKSSSINKLSADIHGCYLEVRSDPYSKFNTINFENDNTNIIQNEFAINHEIYSEVYVFKAINNIPDSLPNIIYYNFRNGIVRYDYPDGRVYEKTKKWSIIN